jgi:hypothetical protein
MAETERSLDSVKVSRRAVLRTAAWTAPVVGLATIAPPAAAASLIITDPVLPVENPLPIPEPTLPQIPVPSDLKTVPPPIPGIPPGPGRPSVVLPDKIPPKIFKPKNPNAPASAAGTSSSPSEAVEAPEPSSTPAAPEPTQTP